MSPQNGILKMIFLFPREDMWVPWRVLLYSYCIWYWGFEMHEAHTIPIHPSIPSLDFTWQSRPSRRYICLWGTTIHHDESHSSHVFWPLEGSCPPSNSSSIFFFWAILASGMASQYNPNVFFSTSKSGLAFRGIVRIVCLGIAACTRPP